jgi:hypothetical protein
MNTFTLREVGESDTESELVLDGRPTGSRVAGRLLEAQFPIATENATVLLVTDDNPYEEALHIHLVNDVGTVLETITVGAPYTPGILKEPRMMSPYELAFDFQRPRRLRVHFPPKGIVRRKYLELSSGSEEL